LIASSTAVIQDPAAGTGGFLTRADGYIKEQTNNLLILSDKEQNFQKHNAFCAVELVDDTHRLLLMNVLLHGMGGSYIGGDSMSDIGKNLPKADVILANPPFGTKKGGKITRHDFIYPTSNRQLCFLQHIYSGLKPGGRAAVVLTDNVLFEVGIGAKVRADLMNNCNLHTILRLPIGIFYSQRIKTNVLFFTRGEEDTGNTKNTWIYDLRTNMPAFAKRTPLTRGHFAEFETLFGNKPDGTSKRVEKTSDGAGQESRFRKFSRDDIAARADNLDISWLRDDTAIRVADLPEPEVLAEMIRERLNTALNEIAAVTAVLDEKVAR
jgi:type I restriction enzyme M protein